MICPFTFVEISTLNPYHTAVIYNHPSNTTTTTNITNKNISLSSLKCGHSCSMSHLIDYLHHQLSLPPSNTTTATTNNSNSGVSKSLQKLSNLSLCPVCLHEPIQVICDAVFVQHFIQPLLSSAQNTTVTIDDNTYCINTNNNIHKDDLIRIDESTTSISNKNETDHNLTDYTTTTLPFVSFQYGKQSYYLSIPTTTTNTALHLQKVYKPISFILNYYYSIRNHNSQSLTQDRIRTVLNLRTEFKIIHKGKVIYPNTNKSFMEISQQLVEISKNDWDHHHHHQQQQLSNERKRGVLFSKPSLVVMGTRIGNDYDLIRKNNTDNTSIVGSVTHAVIYLPFTILKNVISFVYLFFRSVVVLPTDNDENTHDE